MGASASCKMSYCLRVISLRCGSRSDKDVASLARRRLEGPEEAVAGAEVGMQATPLRGHLGSELIRERLVTGSILVASDLQELVFPPVSALCRSVAHQTADLRELSHIGHGRNRVARRQGSKLHPPATEENVGTDQQ